MKLMRGKNMKIQDVLIYFLISLIVNVSYASLSFNTTIIEEVIGRDAEDFLFSFSFENTGKTPVKILDIITSCGCTAVSCDKLMYLPSEKGKLNGKFMVGNLTGLQEKNIIIKTDSISSPLITLQLRLIIPTSITIKPGILVWRLHEPPNGKRVMLKINPDSNLKFENIAYDSSEFNVITEKISELEYELTIIPVRTDAIIQNMLNITCTGDNNMKHEYVIHLLRK